MASSVIRETSVASHSWAGAAFGWVVFAVVALLVLVAIWAISRGRVDVLKGASARPAHSDLGEDAPPGSSDSSLSELEAETADLSVVLADDIAAMRQVFGRQLERCDDSALAAAFTGHNEVVYLARDVGWSDPDVREDVAAVLRQQLGLQLS